MTGCSPLSFSVFEVRTDLGRPKIFGLKTSVKPNEVCWESDDDQGVHLNPIGLEGSRMSCASQLGFISVTGPPVNGAQ